MRKELNQILRSPIKLYKGIAARSNRELFYNEREKLKTFCEIY